MSNPRFPVWAILLFAFACLATSLTAADKPASFPPDPRPKPFTDADYDHHIEQLKKRLPHEGFWIVIQKPFVVVGDESLETNYSQARYLCYYLQERGLLQKFYRSFRKNAATDPTGCDTLKTVLDESDMDDFKKRWETGILKLKFE